MEHFTNNWHALYYHTNYGSMYHPRGQEIKEARFTQIKITEPFDWYRERKLNLDYIRREFQWYLAGSDCDMRIRGWYIEP